MWARTGERGCGDVFNLKAVLDLDSKRGCRHTELYQSTIYEGEANIISLIRIFIKSYHSVTWVLGIFEYIRNI